MNLNYKESLPAGFADDSRVWIYQSNRLFTAGEAGQINEALHTFVRDWKSHGTPVTGYGHLFFGQFIVLLADETASGVSGCSTDSSVRLIKQIEERYDTHLFDRQLLAFVIKDALQLLPLSQINDAVENNFIDAETLYFNNIVQTKQELLDNWIIPVKNSWLGKKIGREKVG
jgi:hypothetical protein